MLGSVTVARRTSRRRTRSARFRAAVEHGVDLVEFDVLDLLGGPLVLAHSDHLEEVSHGRRDRLGPCHAPSTSCARSRPSCRPSTTRSRSSSRRRPTSGCTSTSSSRSGSTSSLLRSRRFGLERRTVVSSFHVPSLHAVAREAPTVRIGFTYPEDRFGVSRRPAAPAGRRRRALTAARAVTARRIPAHDPAGRTRPR